jgi:hypothetical protein
LRASISAKRGARDLDRLPALRVGGGELGLIRVEEAVDDRRGEKLCEPLQHGDYPFYVPSFRRGRTSGQSCAGRSASKTRVNALMTRASIFFARKSCEDGWIAGSSPAMTTVKSVPVATGNDEL